MPTYEYRCRACGEHLEVVQSFRDDPLSECGLCGGDLRKVFSATGIIFKGSGYYVNDSRAAAKAKSDSGEGAAKAGKADKKEPAQKDSPAKESSAKKEPSASPKAESA